MSTVYVLNKDGKPLMPTTRCGHVRRLLKEQKAQVVTSKPFTIQLLYETDDVVQPLYLGIDPGRTNIGVAVVKIDGTAVFTALLETRNKEIPKLMQGRKKARRARRTNGRRCRRQRRAKANGTISKKCVKQTTAQNGSVSKRAKKIGVIKRHLPGCEKEVLCIGIKNKEAKFSNRTRPEGWLTPTANQLLQTHINLVKKIQKFLPISDVVLEINKFAFMRLDNPNVQKWQYQQGPLYQKASLEEAVSEMQEHHCLFCKFIKFLVKLMCGETVKMNTTEDFTATRIDGLKRVCEGLPLNIDDLAKTQFQNHSERVIKNDEWGISDRLVNYPAVSITSNKITSLTKDLSKRAIICRIGAKIDNERGAKNSKRVNESMSELTTAFYGEYVRRMLVCIDEMTTEMRENANGKEYFPDIFHASSSVIADIFEACGIDLPDYVRILYYNDYMGDESIGRAAIEKIELAWQADPSKFRVDKKQNRLIYSYPPDGPWYELKYIADELPNSLEAEISGGNQLIMNYEQAQELFGIKFRRWLGIFNL